MKNQKLFTLEVGAQIELKIERLARGGAGVGRHKGMVVFVPLTAPGDVVLARISRTHKNYAEGELLKIHTASSFRVEPPCHVFGRCGGCSFQHVDYHEQLKEKSQWAQHELAKKIDVTKVIWESAVASPKIFHYRNRVQLHRDGSRLGFFERGSHEVIDVQNCWIADEHLTQKWPELRTELKNQPNVSKIEMAVDENGDIKLSFNKRHGEELGFSQVNSGANEQLIKFVCELVESHGKTMEIWDLYCGKGNFTIPLWRRFPQNKFTGVEANASAISQAQSLVQKLQATQSIHSKISFVCSEVESFLQRHRSIPDNLTVLVDPPRVGCSPQVTLELIRLRPRQLIYVSCDPATFSRDAARFIQAGWQLKRVRPIDLFPHTDHIELLCEFIGC